MSQATALDSGFIGYHAASILMSARNLYINLQTRDTHLGQWRAAAIAQLEPLILEHAGTVHLFQSKPATQVVYPEPDDLSLRTIESRVAFAAELSTASIPHAEQDDLQYIGASQTLVVMGSKYGLEVRV